jgi:hypothetical protein
MRYITPYEAEKYISTQDDILGQPASYFTRIPCSEGKWDYVFYYTDQKKYPIHREGEGKYWVYILSNESMPNIVKIGITKLTPEERAKQISASTGVPIPFKVEFAFKCHEGEFLENDIHIYLDSYRVNSNREFFKIDINEAIDVIKEIGKRYI